MRPRLENAGIDVQVLNDVFLRKHRATGRHSADQGQTKLLAQRVVELNSARCTRQELNHSLARQGAQMLLGSVRRAEPQLGGNLRACRRHSGFGEAALDEAQYPCLAWRQIGHTVIIYSSSVRAAIPMQHPSCRLRGRWRDANVRMACRDPANNPERKHKFIYYV